MGRLGFSRSGPPVHRSTRPARPPVHLSRAVHLHSRVQRSRNRSACSCGASGRCSRSTRATTRSSSTTTAAPTRRRKTLEPLHRRAAAHGPRRSEHARLRPRARRAVPRGLGADAVSASRRHDHDAGRLHRPARASSRADQALRGRRRSRRRRADAAPSRRPSRCDGSAGSRRGPHARAGSVAGVARSVRRLAALSNLAHSRSLEGRRRRAVVRRVRAGRRTSSLLLRAAPRARRVETVALEPRYDVRMRETRIRPWADGLALLRAGRGLRVASGRRRDVAARLRASLAVHRRRAGRAAGQRPGHDHGHDTRSPVRPSRRACRSASGSASSIR